MPKRRPRALRSDELALWEKAVRNTAPLRPLRTEPPPQAPIDKGAGRPAVSAPEPIPRFRLGEKVPATGSVSFPAAFPARNETSAPPTMDKRAYAKLKRGKLGPEARIDLHGMTLADAHPALIRFLLQAHTEDRRLVLVVTGKGDPDVETAPAPVRRGVLRRQVPQWLSQSPLSQIILQVTQAHRRHGGAGALYVYLKRRRA